MKTNLPCRKSCVKSDLDGLLTENQLHQLIKESIFLAYKAEQQTAHGDVAVLDELDRVVAASPVNWADFTAAKYRTNYNHRLLG
jgi:hypothetical protein